MIPIAVALALAWQCSAAMALVADDCAREARVWAVAAEASAAPWAIMSVPEAA